MSERDSEGQTRRRRKGSKTIETKAKVPSAMCSKTYTIVQKLLNCPILNLGIDSKKKFSQPHNLRTLSKIKTR